MPYLSGYDVAIELRKRFSFEQMKLVAVTAYGDPEYRKASWQVGFDAHVQKPVDPAFLESIVKTVLCGE